MAAGTIFPNQYRLPLFGPPDPDLKRAFQIAGPIGLMVLILAYVVPKHTAEIESVDEMPERFAKLILEEPKAPPAPVKLPTPQVAMEKPAVPKVEPIPIQVLPDAGQRRQKPTVTEDRGQAGRERAKKEVEQQLASVTSSLESVLSDVSKSLASSDDGSPTSPRTPRRRKARGGRSAAQLASVGTALPTVGLPDASGSAIGGAQIEIEGGGGGLVSESWVPDGSGGDGTAGASSQLRSDQSLLAVVRRYAPGIQFCYDNELKKQAGLGGKLVVSITVAAAGTVSGATIAKDTVGSAALVQCALAQIEAWKFPQIPEGTVTFQAPFVFTPPE